MKTLGYFIRATNLTNGNKTGIVEFEGPMRSSRDVALTDVIRYANTLDAGITVNNGPGNWVIVLPDGRVKLEIVRVK